GRTAFILGCHHSLCYRTAVVYNKKTKTSQLRIMIEANTLKSIKEIIAGVIEKLGIEADIEVREQPDTVVFNIRTPDSNMIIGQHGVNLSALQYICRVLVKRKLSDAVDFVIDVDDYKKKRESYLSSMAQKAYKEAIN